MLLHFFAVLELLANEVSKDCVVHVRVGNNSRLPDEKVLDPEQEDLSEFISLEFDPHSDQVKAMNHLQVIPNLMTDAIAVQGWLRLLKPSFVIAKLLVVKPNVAIKLLLACADDIRFLSLFCFFGVPCGACREGGCQELKSDGLSNSVL